MQSGRERCRASNGRLIRGHLRAALFAAQAGDEPFDRGGKIARRSGRQILAAPEESYEQGPEKPTRMMPAHEVKLISIAQIDRERRSFGPISDGAGRAAADV